MEYKTKPLTVRLISSEEDFAVLEHSWNALLARSSANTLFLRWEWLFTWWTLFGRRLGQLCIVVVEAEGEPVGIAPFYIKRERVMPFYVARTLRYLGTGEDEAEEIDSEYLSLIIRPGDEGEVVRQVFDRILPLCDAVRLSKMILDSTVVEPLRADFARRGLPCFVETATEAHFIALPQTWEDYLNGLSSAMRYEIRSDHRKLLKQGEVALRVTSSPDELDSDFATLSELHRTHWAAEGLPGVFENKPFSLFHKTILPRLLQDGHLQLCFLTLAGRPIGAAYHFHYHNKFLFYQTGFDRAAAPKASVGLITISSCIERAIQLKCSEYDFLSGGHVYKKRLANCSRTIGTLYIPICSFLRVRFLARERVRALRGRLRRALPAEGATRAPVITGSIRLCPWRGRRGEMMNDE